MGKRKPKRLRISHRDKELNIFGERGHPQFGGAGSHDDGKQTKHRKQRRKLKRQLRTTAADDRSPFALRESIIGMHKVGLEPTTYGV